MLVAMTGQKRSGKNTVAEVLTNFGFEEVSFAGTLKGMIRLLLTNAGLSEDEAEEHINGSKKEEPLIVLQGKSCRYAMQKLGTEWRDFLGKDLWTDIVRLKVQKTDFVVITDMRFLHEERFVDDYDGWKIRVLRYGQPAISADSHPSEQEMASIQENITVYNSGSLADVRKVAFVVAASAVCKDLTAGFDRARWIGVI